MYKRNTININKIYYSIKKTTTRQIDYVIVAQTLLVSDPLTTSRAVYLVPEYLESLLVFSSYLKMALYGHFFSTILHKRIWFMISCTSGNFTILNGVCNFILIFLCFSRFHVIKIKIFLCLIVYQHPIFTTATHPLFDLGTAAGLTKLLSTFPSTSSSSSKP